MGMNRERKYGIALTVVGVLTSPFFVGLPLLAAGFLLLVVGTRLRTDLWIRVLFCLAVVALVLAFAFMLAFPVGGGHDAETDIGRSVLCAAPIFVAILMSLGMAALTAARFPVLSPTYRVMGLGPGVLCVVGAGVGLYFMFPWQMLWTAAVAVTVCACVAWRKLRRKGRAERQRKLPVQATTPAVPRAPAEPPAPVAKPAKPLRTAKPVCGVWALVLVVLALPLGLLVVHGLAAVTDTSDFKGMGVGLAIMGGGIITVIAILFIAMACAIASLRRRERYPALARTLLALFALPAVAVAALYGPFLMVDAVGGTASLAIILTGIGILSGAVLIHRHRKKHNVTGNG